MSLSEQYNPYTLIVYKNSEVEEGYSISKVSDIESSLSNSRQFQKANQEYRRKIIELEALLVDSVESEDDYNTLLESICHHFGISPTKEVHFKGTIDIQGYVQVRLTDLSDFDLDSHISDFTVTMDGDGFVDYNGHSLEDSY